MVVSNTIANPNRSTSVWTRVWRLGRYVWGLDLGNQNEKCLDAFGNGFFGRTPEQKIYEMQIAASSARHSDNPVYHQVLSWPEHETIAPSRFRDIVRDYIDFYKLQHNQIISGLHQDTDNFHIHFVVNRFDVESGRMIQINNGFERFQAARFCCLLEDKYGYTPSENAAAYKVGDEIVLSDLYNVDSARGQIDKKSVALGSESGAQKLKRIVKWALSEAKTWDIFQDRLQAFDVTLRAGPRGGLVYCFNTGSEDEINVAAFRVSKVATHRALAKRFGTDLAEPPDPDTPAPDPSSSLPPRVALDSRPPEPERVEYERYSGLGMKPMDTAEGQLAELVDQLSTLFPKSHVLFDQPVRGAGARVHVLDRARGDSQPLNKVELMSFAPNLENLLQRGRTLRIVPSVDTFDAHNNYALVGPPAALSDLRARGLFPAIVQDDGQQSRFIFLRVGAEDAERLRGAAAQLNCRLEKNPSLLLAANKSVVPVNVDRAHLEPTDVLTRLVRPNRLQFMTEITERLSALRLMLDQLKAVTSSRLTARPAWKLLNPFSRWLSTKSKGDIENAGKANPERSDSGELSAELRSTVVRSRGVDSGTSRDAGDGERQRTDAQNVRRSDGSAQRELGIDFQSSEASRESTGGRKSSAPGSGQYSENPVAAERSRHEIRQNSETAGDFANEPENSARSHWAPVLRIPDGPESLTPTPTPAWRMLRCLQVACENALEVERDDDTADILFFQPGPSDAEAGLSTASALVRVTETAIICGPMAAEKLLDDLRSALPLPVISAEPYPEAVSSEEYDSDEMWGQMKPWSIVPDLEEPELRPEYLDDVPARPARDHVRVDAEAGSRQVSRIQPRPQNLVYDPELLIGDEQLPDDFFYVTSSDDLLAMDLSDLQQLVLLVDDQIGGLTQSSIPAVSALASSAGMPPDGRVSVYMPEDLVESGPEILVFVFDPDAEMMRGPHPDHPATFLVPVRPGETLEAAGISLDNLTQVVLHLQDSEHGPDPEMIEKISTLRADLEGWLQPPHLNTPLEIIESYGDYIDAPWPQPDGGWDADYGLSP